MRRLLGFSIVELLIAVSVIGILATVSVNNYQNLQANARDTNRKQSVEQLSTALSQMYTVRHSYFVYSSKDGGCNGGGGCPDSATSSITLGPNTFIQCLTAGCVGFHGGGWGMVTRKGVSNYPTLSVAQALQHDGFLATIQTDPRTKNFNDDPRNGSVSNFNDFVLTLCDSKSNPPLKPSQAVEFAIFAELEHPSASDSTNASHSCGGPNTISRGWNTLQ